MYIYIYIYIYIFNPPFSPWHISCSRPSSRLTFHDVVDVSVLPWVDSSRHDNPGGAADLQVWFAPSVHKKVAPGHGQFFGDPWALGIACTSYSC